MGVRVRRHLAHAEGVLYGMELGSVTLKRIGFFCFPIKHSTHTHGKIETRYLWSARFGHGGGGRAAALSGKSVHGDVITL